MQEIGKTDEHSLHEEHRKLKREIVNELSPVSVFGVSRASGARQFLYLGQTISRNWIAA